MHDDSPYVRNSALANLAMLDAKSHAGLFGHALNDESLMVVTTAIKGLTAAGDPRRADQVAGYLDHELHDVQHLAATALRAWGWDTDDVRCARVAIPLEEWGSVAGLGAGAVAEVAGLITDDLPWRDRAGQRGNDAPGTGAGTATTAPEKSPTRDPSSKPSSSRPLWGNSVSEDGSSPSSQTDHPLHALLPFPAAP